MCAKSIWERMAEGDMVPGHRFTRKQEVREQFRIIVRDVLVNRTVVGIRAYSELEPDAVMVHPDVYNEYLKLKAEAQARELRRTVRRKKKHV